MIGSSQAKYEAPNQVYLHADVLMLISSERVMDDNPNQVVRSILASSPSPEPMYKEEIKIQYSTFSLIDHVLNY